MGKPLRVLIVEDSEDDAVLLLRELRRGGYDTSHERVDTPEAMSAALLAQAWDIVISDYVMPRFSGLNALKLLQDSGIDLPFILVSGKIGEDIAVDAMKAGAQDYITKGNLARLIPAVERELRDAAVRRRRKRAEEALLDTSVLLEKTFSSMDEAIFVIVPATRTITMCNPAVERIFGYRKEEVIGSNTEFLHVNKEMYGEFVKKVFPALDRKGIFNTEYRMKRKDGSVFDTENTVTEILDDSGSRSLLVSVVRDITERKKAEKEILQQREFLKNIFESLTHPFYVIDASDHTIIMANPAACMGKLTASSKCYELTHGRDKPCSNELACPLEETKKTKKPATIEHIHYDKNGNAKIVEVHGYPIFDSEGKVVQMIEYCLDITERKQAEEALQKSELHYRSLFENMLEGFAFCRMLFENDQPHDFIYLDVNTAFKKLTGLNDVLGKKVTEVIPGIRESHPELFEIYGRVVMTGKPERFEIYLDVIGWLNISVYSLEKGSFVAVFDNITERKKAEEEITFLASIVKNVPEAICSIDLNGKIFSWNKGAEKMLGYNADEIIGKPIAITIPEERARKELDHCIGILNAQGFFTDYESVRLTKDGRVIPVEITAVALKDREQNVTSYTSIIKDITERKKSEALRLENLRLEFMDKAKSEFLANMSHELRTPLNAIIGFSELMKQGLAGKMNEKQERFNENILSSGKFLLSLINDILDLSKIEAGKIELVIERFSVNQAIDETLILIKERASKHNVILKKEFTPQLDIEGDKQRFKQVLFNLLSNAVKFSKEGGGMVTIKTEKEGDMARISVSDTGIGIKEENMGKLFQKFQQLEPEISGKYGGTGLGLAISKQLVELHEGKIWAESKYGEGSTFTFLLPLKQKKEENR